MTQWVLYGDVLSVYTRTARMVLSIKSVPHRIEGIDPFDPDQTETVRALHPFMRVPILHVDEFELYETQAILDYVEARCPDPRLCPEDPQSAARMRQVMSLADSYLYWPLVRQAAVQHVFNPLLGDPVDQDDLQAGLDAAPRVLDALEDLATEGFVLGPGQATLADCHLWPMMDYALMVPEIAEMVGRRSALAAWCEAMSEHPAAIATAPDLKALRI